MSGLFITIEGIDGCGKSTQAQRLAELLRSTGRTVTAVREPGSSALAERVRSILLDPEMTGVSPRAELLLYVACRAELVEKTIRPALTGGGTVVGDRFSDSTVAYQGYGRQLGPEVARQANLIATGGLSPDVTFLIDVPLEVAGARMSAKSADRLEGEQRAFHERVRHGFLEIARGEPERVFVVDGTLPADEVTEQIIERLVARVPGLRNGRSRCVGGHG